MLDRWRIAFFTSLALALWGCAGESQVADDAAKPGAPGAVSPAGASEPGGAAAPAVERPWTELNADELDSKLSADRAGRALAAAIRAHGGWESWRRLERVVVQVERRAPALPEPAPDSPEASITGTPAPAVSSGGDGEPHAPEASAAGGAAARVHAIEIEPKALRPCGEPPAAGARPSPAAASGSAAPACPLVYGVPFTLASPELQAEYLGVERDLASGEVLVKVRYAMAAAGAPFPLVAYFDKESHLVRRLLVAAGDGRFEVVFLDQQLVPLAPLKSNDQEASVVRFSMRRAVHPLPSRLSHPDRSRPAYVETVVDLRAIPSGTP
jgi:hypothetical protein